MDESRFTLSMLDSAEHSLINGVDHLKDALQNDDVFAMKQAILNVCHGIELTLKQLVVKEDPLFIFEDPGKAANALMELRMAQGTREATLLDLLKPENDVMTVGYKNLADRAAKLLVIKDLLPSHKKSREKTLRDRMDELVAQRNRLMHSVAELDLQEDGALLLKVVEPFHELATRELGDTPFTYGFYNRLDHLLRNAQVLLENYTAKISGEERWILTVAKKFGGQIVPGELFGQEKDVQLPEFNKATIRREPAPRTFLVSSASESWLIVAEAEYRNKEQMVKVHSHSKRYEAKLWLIADPGTYAFSEIFLSTIEDVKRLESILAAN